MVIASIRPRHGQPSGRREELEGRAAGACVDLTRRDIGQTARNSVDGQARNDARRGVGLFGRGHDLDPHRAARQHEIAGPLEYPGSPMTSGRARACSRRISPAFDDHLGTDARDVAHRQADNGGIRLVIHFCIICDNVRL